MNIDEALRATCREHGLSPEALAVAGQVSANSAKSWCSIESPKTPSGDKLLVLMRSLPGFAEKLGFSKLGSTAAVA